MRIYVISVLSKISNLSLLLLQVYSEAVESPRCNVIHMTHVEADVPCDTFFPDITAAGQLHIWLWTCG